MGFDSRAADAMLKLGYRIFPFEAFDTSGNLRIPDSVDYPPDVASGLSRITANPMWKDIYRTMSPLQRSDKVFMAGVGLVNERVQIALFKSTTTVGDQRLAMNWSQGYHDTTAATIQQYAGTAYLLDPAYRDILEKARAGLPPALSDIEKLPSEEVLFASAEEEPPDGATLLAAGVVPWLKFGLDVLLEFVTKVAVRTKVLTTVVWYPASPASLPFAQNWTPIHTDWQTGWLSGHRTAHLIWNPVGSPVTWRGSEISWKGPGMDMPHEPAQWCQALSPLSNCTNRPPTLDELSEIENQPATAQ